MAFAHYRVNYIVDDFKKQLIILSRFTFSFNYVIMLKNDMIFGGTQMSKVYIPPEFRS